MKKFIIIALIFIGNFANAQTTLKPEGKQIVPSGTSVSVNAGTSRLIVNTGGVLATLTITFPSTPNDCDVLEVIFVNNVTLLTLTGNVATTITNAVANTMMRFEYVASLGKWYKIT